MGHVRRTQIYAVGVGEVLDLSPDEIQALHTGALLHDIGKLAVPDHILNKPGRLTPAEMEKMKIHSTVGASILAKVNFPYPVVPTVKHHHEMWDGSGYPDGLVKEEIPLTARILFIADAYDTLRGARPFREAVSRDEARKFLLSGAGTQFDPKLVDVFLRNLRKFETEVDREGLSYDLDAASEEDLMINVEPNAIETGQGYVAQIKRANREVFTLYELARVFSTSLNLQDTLSLFVKKIGELVPFDTCAIYLFDKTQETATAVYVEGKNAVELKDKKVKPGEGATGFVLKKRQSVNNINPGLDFSFYQMEFMPEYSAMASLPLITDEKLIGAVSLYSCELETYEDEHMRLMETISRIASDAISKSLHFTETESRAMTDPMTGLPNARSLQLQFETEVGRAKRNNSQFQVLMLDLDGFKKVNDTFGHKAGDMLLKEISRVMRGQLRDYDFLARYAGDEFVAIIPETDETEIAELCERIEKAVLGFELPIGDGRFAKVGVSLGSSCYPKSGETLDQVIIAADKAMYSVKATHKQKQTLSQPAVSSPQLPAPATAVQTIELTDDAFIVELDESSIISSAVN
jgi:diguanylate cyclase (GGDEF)-like protein/putative nucleotidyltransferase with HDIG domain